ncbi:hypothetical protein DFP72DRAFT_880687 [Ephemerocybe angulata]|uniref:Uncharacterized protein n=1 Tax=Ephemerocybe angulata TaxID=980116 RepID=A0A8H6I9C6_9AGAR|nr:hypothetical protein DFP72DRAFT_880687 [Tulosesus angulatus]
MSNMHNGEPDGQVSTYNNADAPYGDFDYSFMQTTSGTMVLSTPQTSPSSSQSGHMQFDVPGMNFLPPNFSKRPRLGEDQLDSARAELNESLRMLREEAFEKMAANLETTKLWINATYQTIVKAHKEVLLKRCWNRLKEREMRRRPEKSVSLLP